MTTRDGKLLPTSACPYIAYDLLWDDEDVAVQYVGKTLDASPSDRMGLGEPDMSIICVCDRDLSDAHSLSRIAHEIARLLDEELPEETNEWKRAHDHLLEDLEVPTFDRMCLTTRDIRFHLACD